MSSMPTKTVMGTGTLRPPVPDKPAVSLRYDCNSDAFFQAEISRNSLAVSSIMEPSLIFHCTSAEDDQPPAPSPCSHLPQCPASEMWHVAPFQLVSMPRPCRATRTRKVFLSETLHRHRSPPKTLHVGRTRQRECPRLPELVFFSSLPYRKEAHKLKNRPASEINRLAVAQENPL